MEEPIVNRIAQSGLITIDLGEYFPSPEEVAVFDIQDYLFQGLILREKDYRRALQEKDWQPYQNKYVGIVCSADAIIPLWAYMLPVHYLQPVARKIYYGDREAVRQQVAYERIQLIPAEQYQGQRVLVKGCGDESIPPALYIAISEKLKPYVKSLMYGEACSNIPIFKRKDNI
ncbi:MAG: DUF2480 family protein [Thermoflavifilum sp.]|nr:DUF2480 family protein [Thermoflavifilum sp.]